MKSTLQRTITPVDGSVYLTRKLATASAIENALSRATKAQKAWKQVPVAERARDLPPHGRLVRRQGGRARHRIELADGPAGVADAGRAQARVPRACSLHVFPGGKRARRSAGRSEAGFPALHPARAARRGAGRRAVELPMADFRERGDPRAAGGQQRDPEDGGADAARRRALRGSVQGRRPARGRIPVPASRPRPGRQAIADPRIAFVAFTGSVPAARRCSAPPPSASSAPASSSAARTRPTCAPTPTSSSRSRIWSTAATSTPASPAAASSGFTSTADSLDRLCRRIRRPHAPIPAGESTGEGNHPRPAGANRRGRQRARADQQATRRRREGAAQAEGQAGYAVPCRRRCW